MVRQLGDCGVAPEFVKVGLAGCRRRPAWRLDWNNALSHLPAGTGRVAVAYADFETVEAPTPGDVLEFAVAAGCQVILMDTFAKAGRRLLDCLSLAELAPWTDAARSRGLQVALAGSLTLSMVPKLLALAPDWIAVRGAACRGGRSGTVDTHRVAELAAQLFPAIA